MPQVLLDNMAEGPPHIHFYRLHVLSIAHSMVVWHVDCVISILLSVALCAVSCSVSYLACDTAALSTVGTG